MKTFTKLDPEIVALLCCPLCKAPLRRQADSFTCNTCRSCYPAIDTGAAGRVYDFRIHRPSFARPASFQKWLHIQSLYERWSEEGSKRDDPAEYRAEIDSVGEIYLTEFHLMGNVLDVGGHQGRLRHYLADQEVPLYISVDPFINVFDHAAGKSNLLAAYSCLSKPCNFLSCHAEHLPFMPDSFDWVHMRSVLDHFEDPYVALKEALRVIRPTGRVLIGLAIMEKLQRTGQQPLSVRVREKLKQGLAPTFKAAAGKLAQCVRPEEDDHNFRLKHQELLDLLCAAGFALEKEHWQKPPAVHVLYVSARRLALD